MFQLHNLINRSTVPSDPSNNMNTSEDFLLLLLHAHVVAAAKTFGSHESVTDLAKSIVNSVILSRTDESHEAVSNYTYKVYLYAVELLSLALLWHGFHDAIKEGDGERLLRYWKFLLVLFTSSNHPNYAKEAVNLLLQYYYIFSERKKAQLLWSRCVNTRGYQGTNIPCDLFMEHLNRRLKSILRGMGANINLMSVAKAGKALAPVQHICQTFERQTCHHSSFNFKCCLLEKVNKKDLTRKVKTSIEQLYLC